MITYTFIHNHRGRYICSAQDDVEAEKLATAFFGENASWEISNEGEDTDGRVTHVIMSQRAQFYVVVFFCRHHPGDSRTVGVFSTEDAANQAIDDAMAGDARAYPNHPRRDEQDRYQYHVDLLVLDEPS